MEVLYQSNVFSSVKKVHSEELLASSSFLSTELEAVAQLRADIKSFRITEARWDIFRSPGDVLNGGRNLDELKGVEAYFSAGGALRKAAGDEGGGLPRELLADCVRGIIQAETFVFTGRGYPTAKEYEQYWDGMYLDSCRYYSNLDRVQRKWFDYVDSSMGRTCLFNRSKSCVVYRQPGGELSAFGAFSDSFHELGVHVSFTGEGVITSSTGNFLRAPDQVCFENSAHLSLLVGKSIAGIGKKEVAVEVGGPQGCSHLVDLIYDVGKAVARGVKLFNNREV